VEARGTNSVETLTRLIGDLTEPILHLVDSRSLLPVPAPDELAHHRVWLDYDATHLDPTHVSAVVHTLERAQQVGVSHTVVHLKDMDEPKRLTIMDLTDALGMVAYVFSDDAVEDPVADGSPGTDAKTITLNAAGSILTATPAAVAFLQQGDGRVLGCEFIHSIHPEDLQDGIETFVAVTATLGTTQRVRMRILTEAAAYRWVELHGRAELVDAAIHLTCSLIDVDDEVRSAEALAESERRFRMLAESTPVGVVRVDHKGHIRFSNAAFHSISGLARGHADEWFELTHPDDLARLISRFERFMTSEDVFDEEFRILPHAGDGERSVRVVARQMRSPDGQITDIIASIVDMTDRVLLEQKLAHDATHDDLTGLANRALLRTHLEERLRRARDASEPLAVIFIDLDDFKRINDSHGHTVGDEVLQRLADRVQSSVRPDDLVARFGGDEFVVVADAGGGPDSVLSVAHRVQRALAQPFDIVGTPISARASIGVALETGRGASADALLSEADAAMYAAKSQGRGRIHIADGQSRSLATRRLKIESELPEALDEDRLTLLYQPLVDLTTGRISGAESLLRWLHPDLGLLPPAELIPVAESSGLTHQLSLWGADRLARDIAQLRSSECELAEIGMAINLSNAQLSVSTICDDLVAVLARHSLQPSDLIVEITESQIIGRDDAAESAIRALDEAGVCIALDDFGSGYSTLEYLTRLPVRHLKVDRHFIQLLPRNDRARKIVSGLVAISNELGMSVVAEGIETVEELECCQEIGIDEGQGFLLQRPTPFPRLLSSGWIALGSEATAPV
jgi:diguanylate cyclase (GGDEF)-like protein/PAS domain S-box-containing protein